MFGFLCIGYVLVSLAGGDETIVEAGFLDNFIEDYIVPGARLEISKVDEGHEVKLTTPIGAAPSNETRDKSPSYQRECFI